MPAWFYIASFYVCVYPFSYSETGISAPWHIGIEIGEGEVRSLALSCFPQNRTRIEVLPPRTSASQSDIVVETGIILKLPYCFPLYILPAEIQPVTYTNTTHERTHMEKLFCFYTSSVTREVTKK